MNETNCVSWKSDNPICQSYGGNEPCHLCGEPDASVYMKGHSRENGVMLEDSLLYCKNCDESRKEEVRNDFGKWWQEKWAECEAKCEENWKKYGIYGNCWDIENDKPSAYFGYVKNEDGTFTPYRYIHPETIFEKFDGALHFEFKRIVELSISGEEKFAMYREFMINFEPDNTQLDYYRNNKIKGIDEWVTKAKREIKSDDN